MSEPLKNKLRCSICNKLIESCKCVDDDGDKYEPDLEEDLFVGYDVQLAVELLKERWKHQCKCMFGADWNEAKDFKIFYNDFLEEIDKTFPDLNIGKSEIE